MPNNRSTTQQYALSQEINQEGIWKIVWEHIKLNIPSRAVNVWFKNFYLKDIKNKTAYFSCETDFKREWIESNHRTLIKKATVKALTTWLPTPQSAKISKSICRSLITYRMKSRNLRVTLSEKPKPLTQGL